MRAMYDHEKIVITAITTASPGWRWKTPKTLQPSLLVEQAATIPTAIRIWGTASSTSDARERIVSVKPPKKPGGQADDQPDQHGEARGDDADEERRPCAVHRADEEVTAGGVGAEPEFRIRSLRHAELVRHLGVGRVLGMAGDLLGDRAAEDRDEDEQDDHDPARERCLVLLEPVPEEARGRLACDLGLLERNGAAGGHLEVWLARHTIRKSVIPRVGSCVVILIIVHRPEAPV